MANSANSWAENCGPLLLLTISGNSLLWKHNHWLGDDNTRHSCCQFSYLWVLGEIIHGQQMLVSFQFKQICTNDLQVNQVLLNKSKLLWLDTDLFSFSDHLGTTRSTGNGQDSYYGFTAGDHIQKQKQQMPLLKLDFEWRFCAPSLVLYQPLLMPSNPSTSTDTVDNSLVEQLLWECWRITPTFFPITWT